MERKLKDKSTELSKQILDSVSPKSVTTMIA